MNKAEFDKLMQEMVECSEGRRGWVSLTKARAASIKIAHDIMLGSARAMGLKVEQHGKHGWSASA